MTSFKKFSLLFIKMFFGALVWILIFSFIIAWSNSISISLAIWLTLTYLLISLLIWIFFRKREKIIGDKSFKAVIINIKEDIINSVTLFLTELKKFVINLFWIAFALGIFSLFGWGISTVWGWTFSSKDNNYNEYEPTETYNYEYTGKYYDDEEADYYNDYPVGFEGTDTMEACNGNTGNCYDLEIDSDGQNVERINFPNGGWRDVNYSDCEEGYCVVEDEDGTEWELQY